MVPLATVAAILGLFVLLVTLIAWVDGLTILAPRSSAGIRAAAEYFCSETCRIEGRCPLAATGDPAPNCPLRRFIDADAPTLVRGRPRERPFEVAGA